MSATGQFCTKCGAALAEGAGFCARCGTPVEAGMAAPAPPPIPPKRKRSWRGFWVIAGGLVLLVAIGASRSGSTNNGTAAPTVGGIGSGTNVPAAANAPTVAPTAAGVGSGTSIPGAVANAPTVAPTPKPAPTQAATMAPPPGLNQIVSVKNWDLAVATVMRPGKELVWSQYGNKSAAAGTWLIVAVDMKNTGMQNYGVNTSDFTLYGPGGVKYAVSTDPGAYGYSEFKGGQSVGGQVPPGVSVRYYVVFDVAPDASGLLFRFNQDKEPTFAIGDAAQ